MCRFGDERKRAQCNSLFARWCARSKGGASARRGRASCCPALELKRALTWLLCLSRGCSNASALPRHLIPQRPVVLLGCGGHAVHSEKRRICNASQASLRRGLFGGEPRQTSGPALCKPHADGRTEASSCSAPAADGPCCCCNLQGAYATRIVAHTHAARNR